MIIRGTTPTLKINIDNLNIDYLTKAIFTFNNSLLQISFPGDNCIYDYDNTQFKITMTQEQTLSLSNGTNFIQVQLVYANTTTKTFIQQFEVAPTLATEIVDITTLQGTDEDVVLNMTLQDTIEIILNNDHNLLTNRNLPNQHDISSITNLQSILDTINTNLDEIDLTLSEVEVDLTTLNNKIVLETQNREAQDTYLNQLIQATSNNLNDKINDEISTRQQNVSLLNNYIENLQTQVDNNTTQISALFQNDDTLNSNLSLLSNHLTTIQSELNLERERINSLSESNNIQHLDFITRLNSLDTTYNALNLTVQALSQQVATNTGNIALVDVKAQKGAILVDSFVQKYLVGNSFTATTTPTAITLNDATAIDNDFFSLGANGTTLICKQKGISIIEGIANISSGLSNNTSIIYTCYKNGVAINGTQSFLARTNLLWKFYIEHNVNDVITIRVSLSTGSATLNFIPNSVSRAFRTIKLT